jgi:ribulose 1,5-bisphosphate synthetase/thiazole synthase
MIRWLPGAWLALFATLSLRAGERYDVAVYGATASGVIAAVAAAREGATVALIEPTRHIGGAVSGGLSATDKGREQTIGGIAREFFTRVGKRYGRDGPVCSTSRTSRTTSSFRCSTRRA